MLEYRRVEPVARVPLHVTLLQFAVEAVAMVVLLAGAAATIAQWDYAEHRHEADVLRWIRQEPQRRFYEAARREGRRLPNPPPPAPHVFEANSPAASRALSFTHALATILCFAAGRSAYYAWQASRYPVPATAVPNRRLQRWLRRWWPWVAGISALDLLLAVVAFGLDWWHLFTPDLFCIGLILIAMPALCWLAVRCAAAPSRSAL